MGIKISELPGASSVNRDDYLVLNHESETCQVSVQTLMYSYLSEAGYMQESQMDSYLSEYLGSNLGEYMSSYLSENLGGFLSSYLSEYMRWSNLSEALGSYVTDSTLEQTLYSYVTSSYLSEAIGGFITSSELSEALNGFITTDYLGEYLSSRGVVTSDNFSDALGNNFSGALENYLSIYGGEVIYNAISQYINPEG